MKISNSYVFDQAIRQLQARQARLDEVQAQIASGQRIARPSDDTAQINPLQRLEGIASRQTIYESNLASLQDRLEAEESVVSASTQALDRIRELTIAGINDTNQQDVDRVAIAAEIDALIEQLRGFANAQDINGNYLFAGSRVTTAPFQVDASGRTVYLGDQYRNSVPVGEGRALQGNRPADEVFVPVARQGEGSAAVAVPFFRALEELSVAMRAGSSDLSSRVGAEMAPDALGDGAARLVLSSDQTETGLLRIRVAGDPVPVTQTIRPDGSVAIDFGDRRFNVGDAVQLSIERYTAAEVPVLGADDVDAAGRLTEAGLQKLADAINASTPADPGPLQRGLAEIDALGLGLVSALATIGGEQNAVERQQGLLEDDRLRTTVLLSDIRDLDYNEAVTRLKQELLSLEAFQRSFAQTTQLGLFDFLN